jgi:hypothetical protein
MATWDYILHPVSTRDSKTKDKSMNELTGMGHKGWEAVGWIPDPDAKHGGYVLLKKPA